jgi:hypothetical protein
MTDQPITDYRCRSCGVSIVWVKTPKGKNMPVNASSAQPGDIEFDRTRHIPHWASCPQANRWRK